MHAICVTDDQGNVPFVVVIIMSFLSTTYSTKKLTMLHIRLTFIGIKTGWAPKLSAGPLEKKFGSPAGPWRKNVKLCPCGTRPTKDTSDGFGFRCINGNCSKRLTTRSIQARTKLKFKTMKGVSADDLPSYLHVDERMWWDRWGKTTEDAFNNLCAHIAEQYPV